MQSEREKCEERSEANGEMRRRRSDKRDGTSRGWEPKKRKRWRRRRRRKTNRGSLQRGEMCFVPVRVWLKIWICVTQSSPNLKHRHSACLCLYLGSSASHALPPLSSLLLLYFQSLKPVLFFATLKWSPDDLPWQVTGAVLKTYSPKMVSCLIFTHFSKTKSSSGSQVLPNIVIIFLTPPLSPIPTSLSPNSVSSSSSICSADSWFPRGQWGDRDRRPLWNLYA